MLSLLKNDLGKNTFFTEKYFGGEIENVYNVENEMSFLETFIQFFISLWNYSLNRLQNIFLFFFINNKFHFKFFLVPGTA